jgi:hypothetical protein
MQPSYEWLEQTKHVHKYFDKFHLLRGFNNGQNLVKRQQRQEQKYNREAVSLTAYTSKDVYLGSKI